MENNLKGRRVIVVLRSSLDELAAKSIPQQREACQAYAKEHGIVIVDEVVLWGMSATTGKQEKDLKILLARKIGGEEFDGLLFYDLGRFSRIVEDATECLQNLQMRALRLSPRRKD